MFIRLATGSFYFIIFLFEFLLFSFRSRAFSVCGQRPKTLGITRVVLFAVDVFVLMEKHLISLSCKPKKDAFVATVAPT